MSDSSLLWTRYWCAYDLWTLKGWITFTSACHGPWAYVTIGYSHWPSHWRNSSKSNTGVCKWGGNGRGWRKWGGGRWRIGRSSCLIHPCSCHFSWVPQFLNKSFHGYQANYSSACCLEMLGFGNFHMKTVMQRVVLWSESTFTTQKNITFQLKMYSQNK